MVKDHPVDETNTPIQVHQLTVQQRSTRSTKGGETPTPVIPGCDRYSNVTPSNPGTDTPVVYRKADQKAIIKYVDKIQIRHLPMIKVGGKSGEAINYSAQLD